MRPSRWARLVDVLVVPAVVVLLAWEPNAAHGFVDYFEAGQYLAPINRLLHGEVLFRDTYILFGPLFFYVPALAMQVFGASLAVLRLHFEALAILTMLVAYWTGTLVCRDRLFRCLVPFLVIVEAYHPFWAMRWGGFRTGWALLGLGFMVRALQHGRRRDVVAAGVVNGLGLAYSLDVGAGLLATGVVVAAWCALSDHAPPRRVAAGLGLYLAGLALAFAPFLVHAAIRGGLADYLHVAFWVLPSHRTAWSQPYAAPSLLAVYRAAPSLPWLATTYTFKIYLPGAIYAGMLGVLAWTALRRRATPDVAVLAPLTVYGVIAYTAAFRAVAGPQFQMALLPLIVLGAALLERCYHVAADGPAGWADVRAGARRASLAVMVLVLAAAFILASEKRYHQSLLGWLWYQASKSDLAAFYGGPATAAMQGLTPIRAERGGGSRVPRPQADEIDGVTAYLRETTTPDEVVFAFPEHGMFNFFADRPALGRLDIPGMAGAIPAWREELLANLAARPPRIVVMGRGVPALARSITGTDELLPEVRAYLGAHYRPVRVFATVMVLERVP